MAQLARRRPTKHRQGSRRKNALPISSILQKKKEPPAIFLSDWWSFLGEPWVSLMEEGKGNIRNIGEVFFELLQR